MSSGTKKLTAERRFELAFERLKEGVSEVLPIGTPVTQNNVAKEAGRDPSALRKERFPSLVRAIQAYVELHQQGQLSERQVQLAKRALRRELKDQLAMAKAQRDHAQSQLISASRRIVELRREVEELRGELLRLRPLPPGL